MRRFACLTYVLLASAAVAAPTKPIRKPAPPGLGADQLETFVHAIIADKAGEYDRAASRYRGLETVPAAVYNQADLERRRERYQRALELYRKYLDIAPNAPDRAAVQKLIAQLEQTPMTVVVDGEDLDAVVFIDGKPAGPSPLVTPLADGHHVVDRIGPTSYKHEV
ncbi:MAG TPA: tetratricopeptide repeat protein, partial [Kofleriaceae bacterium]|nr:tetratricopeptide repeat protein [Kofleriaceae bacterium]